MNSFNPRATKQVKGKIILIDDEKYEKDLLANALRQKSWDIKVEYFDNAEDALEHLRKNADEIFLIISDMDMPKTDGMSLKKVIDTDDYLTKVNSLRFHEQCYRPKKSNRGI